MTTLKISRTLSGPTASDLTYRKQWAWDKIEVEQGWQRIEQRQGSQASSEKPVTVAIVDWGIQRGHKAFGPGLVARGANVIPTGDGNIGDDDGHGTMLAGTIAGVVTNIPGGGRTPSSIRLLPVKFIDARNPPTSGNATKAINYAVDAGAKIINASWDIGFDSGELRRAMQYAEEQDVLVVLAAGNGGSNNTDYPTVPASFPLSNMIIVMASDETDQKPGFSNYGNDVHIAAPGVNIISTSPYSAQCQAARSPFAVQAYRRYSGTSPAAAHVSGAAALLLSINPLWTAQDLRACLLRTADPIARLEPFCPGGRRLNIDAAVKSALQDTNGVKAPNRTTMAIVCTRLQGLEHRISALGSARLRSR